MLWFQKWLWPWTWKDIVYGTKKGLGWIFLWKRFSKAGECTWGKSMSLGMLSVTGFKEQSNIWSLAVSFKGGVLLHKAAFSHGGWGSQCRGEASECKFPLTESAKLCKVLSDWINRQVLHLNLFPKALCPSKDRPSTEQGKSLDCYFHLLPSLKRPSSRVTGVVHTIGIQIGKRQNLWCLSQFAFHVMSLYLSVP